MEVQSVLRCVHQQIVCYMEVSAIGSQCQLREVPLYSVSSIYLSETLVVWGY